MPQQERARITRQKILEAAADVIYRVGFANATLGDITEAAGVTKGALYFHFVSKEDIAHALIDEQHRVSREGAAAILAVGGSPVELMMRLCMDLSRRLMEDRMVRAGIRLTTDASTFETPLVDPYLDWMATFETLAGQAIDAGELTPAVTPAQFARVLIPSFTGIQLVSETFTERADLPERIHELWIVLLNATASEVHRDALLSLASEIFTPR
jgi:AcrR family transcriptional regulator